MTSDEVRRAIEEERSGVVLFYGSYDFTPGSNFIFAVMPKSGQGAQWHRDIIPALRRYLKKFNRPFGKSVVGSEGWSDKDALVSLNIREHGDNDRLWIAFEWEETDEGKRRGLFREVEFDGITEEILPARMKRAGLPAAPAGCKVRRIREIAATGDWWLDTDRGWYWLETYPTREWKPALHGPE